MSACHQAAFSDLTYRFPSQGPRPWGGAFGVGYQLAVVLVIELKLSSAVDRLSTAAIYEV